MEYITFLLTIEVYKVHFNEVYPENFTYLNTYESKLHLFTFFILMSTYDTFLRH